MNCLKCNKFTECTVKAETDESLAHKMWMYEFWGNASELCKGFALVINKEVPNNDKS